MIYIKIRNPVPFYLGFMIILSFQSDLCECSFHSLTITLLSEGSLLHKIGGKKVFQNSCVVEC